MARALKLWKPLFCTLIVAFCASVASAQATLQPVALSNEAEATQANIEALENRIDYLASQRPSRAGGGLLTAFGAALTVPPLLIFPFLGASGPEANARESRLVLGGIFTGGIGIMLGGIFWLRSVNHARRPTDLEIMELKRERRRLVDRLEQIRYGVLPSSSGFGMVLSGAF